MRADGYRVLVVGAGIAGLAAARALRRWGAEVEVVERAPSPSTAGAGIYLPGNALRALDALGLAGAVLAASVPIERQQFCDRRGRVLADVDVAAYWRGVGDCRAMPRADLLRIMLDGAEGVPVRWGSTTTALDGPHDLVIGADGVHSTVRGLLFGTAATPVGQYARRFVLRAPGDERVWRARLGRESAFLTIPIGEGRLYCYYDTASERHELAGFAEPVPSLLAGAADPHSGPVEEVALPRWSRGNVVLIGDAAHATSPNMAQGAAMAVEDALVLADSLEQSATTADALVAYEERRRPRTDWVLAMTHRRDRTRALPAVIRSLVLRRAGRKIFDSHYRPLRAAF